MKVEIREGGDVLVTAGDSAISVRHAKGPEGEERWDVCVGNVKTHGLAEVRVYTRDAQGVPREIGRGRRMVLRAV